MTYFAYESLADPQTARGMLATLLSSGQLSLFLGAGVSFDLKLPDWASLVAACEVRASLPIGSGVSAPELMTRMDAVQAALGTRAFAQAVREELYPADYRARHTYPDEIIRSHMLIALGAMVMSSSRGSISDVLTLNFDDVLEWYLHLHGFRVQSIAEVPALAANGADVRIFHYHGFAPLTQVAPASRDLIFAYNEYESRKAEDAGSPWPTILNHLLMTKSVLFVGTSLIDEDIHLILENAKPYVFGDRPLGFLVTAELEDADVLRIRQFGIVPVVLDSYESIPEFLLSVCRVAARSLGVKGL